MHFRQSIAAIVLCIWLPTGAANAAFVDLNGSPYEEAIVSLAGDGIISGYSDGTTRPYEALSRAEALKVVIAARSQYAQEFADTQKNMPTIPLFGEIGRAHV